MTCCSPTVKILWSQLAIALILLWFPRQWLRVGGHLFRSRHRRSESWSPRDRPDLVREPGDNSIYFRIEFTKFRNYVDFFRAAVGGLAVVGGLMDVQPAVQASAAALPWQAVAVQYMSFALLMLGVLVQSFRFEKRASMFPPIFYLSGLTLGLCGFDAAGFAVVMTWAINSTLPGPTSFLTIYALLVGIFGYLLRDDNVVVAFAAGLVFLPVLISLLAKKRLVHFAKKVKAGG